MLWFLVFVCIFLAVTTTLGNTVILAALHEESSLHPPSKILLRSLALADLCVGIVVVPLYVTFLLTIEFENWNLCYHIIDLVLISGQALCSVSLLTLTAISVDRLLALLLGMRYRQVVTLKRVQVVVISLWIMGSCGAMMTLLDYIITLYYGSIVILLCIIVSTCCYIKIYQKLWQHQAQIQEHIHQGQPNGHEPLNIARYRKTVSSALWIQFSILACYIPGGIVITLVAIIGITPILFFLWVLSVSLIQFNSTLNPVLYCWKIREVRQVVIEITRQMFCL